jgi:hypothetical protein
MSRSSQLTIGGRITMMIRSCIKCISVFMALSMNMAREHD